MREIKFRAWDKRRGRMRFGNDNLLISLGGLLFWDVGYKEPDMLGEEERQDYVLIQYTGLKDKNGAEMYEGDVVNTVSAAPVIYQQIIYFPPEFMLQDKYGFHRLLAGVTEEFYEVIGNIYENPELIDGQS